MSTARDKAEKKKAEQPHDPDHDYDVGSGIYKSLEDLPKDTIWVVMEPGKGNINLGNNSKYAREKKLDHDVGDDGCSAEGGVSLAYLRKIRKA